MCGIVGVIGSRSAAPILLDALHRLEYRGYDSAGIATLVQGQIQRRRAEGKLANLDALLARLPLEGTTGIGHTRWATHGPATETNAHPHGTSRVSVVHNGIIENHHELRSELEAQGQIFLTDTDTESIAQLVDHNLRHGMSPVKAVEDALSRLEGTYAVAMMFSGYGDLIIGAQRGAPLAVGYGDNEMYLGSDSLALAPLTQDVTYLDDGDWAVINRGGVRFFDASGAIVQRRTTRIRLTNNAVGKGKYRHYMEKELHEHSAVIENVLQRLVNVPQKEVSLPDLKFDAASIERVTISACGSAFYAGMVGRWWFESIGRLPADIDIASEFRYRTPPMNPGDLGILVSQSGETADTLAALKYMRAQGQHLLSIVNVPESSMARASDAILDTDAGPELSVASTKAFTAQLTVLACLALGIGKARGEVPPEDERRLVRALLDVPHQADELLARKSEFTAIARSIVSARDVLYLGRGGCYPIALEGALKLKEITYVHAEAYAAGELKHGPIALIDSTVPVIAVAPSGPLFEKTASNLQEAAARGGQVIVFSDEAGAAKLRGLAVETMVLPQVDPFVVPLLYAIPMQWLAYQVAVLKGTDVDQPRNLAKSVTVE